MNITISDDYQDCTRYLACFDKLAGHAVHVLNDSAKEPAEIAARFGTAEALVLTRERTEICADVLDRLPRLRMISQTGRVGRHLDLDACTERGIAVADTSGDGSPAAELTWALVLASRRHLVREVNRLHDGLWQGHVGRRLRGKVLGIWGYGRIGRLVAGYGKAFGMTVQIWGSAASMQAAQADGLSAAPTREAFFSNSDVLSLHLRLTPQTTGIVRLADLRQMKETALLVNTSRAALIEPRALERAARQGRPGFVAIDVFEDEPVLGARHPLLALPNVLATPHIGFVEHDNYENYYGSAFDNILWYLQGRSDHLLNPQVMRHERQTAA